MLLYFLDQLKGMDCIILDIVMVTTLHLQQLKVFTQIQGYKLSALVTTRKG